MAVGRPCRVCRSPQHDAIEGSLLGDDSLERISKRFEISVASLFRHRAGHMRQKLRDTPAVERGGLDLWQQLRAINGVCLETLNNARLRGDDRVVLLAVDRVLRQLELSAKLMGDMTSDQTTVNVQIGEWPVLRQRIVGALELYPEARLRVLESLNGHAGH